MIGIAVYYEFLVVVLLYVHTNCSLIRDGSPGRPPRLSHSSLLWEVRGQVSVFFENHCHFFGCRYVWFELFFSAAAGSMINLNTVWYFISILGQDFSCGSYQRCTNLKQNVLGWLCSRSYMRTHYENAHKIRLCGTQVIETKARV